MKTMHLTLLGGAESAGFVRDLAALLGSDDTLTVVFNTAHDLWAHGLKRSPDANMLLTVLEAEPPRTPTFAVADEIAGLGIEPTWLRASDQDVALDVVRTELMQADFTLTEITAALAARRGITTTLVPMSNDRVEQHAVVHDGDGSRAIHIAEYLATHAGQPVHDLVLVADDWQASGEATTAIENADVIVFGPASMSLTLMPLLHTPGVVESIAASAAPVVDVHVVDPAPRTLTAFAADIELKFDLAVKATPDPAEVIEKARGLL